MHPNSQEKTAFVTQKVLYEFRVRLVIKQLEQAGLKLKPSKCHFVRKEVECLGHIITANRLKPNHKHVLAVKAFPVPKKIKELI